MSGQQQGGGGGIVLHQQATKVPVTVAVSDLQAWADSLDASNPLKAMLNDYIASIPSD